MKHPVYVFSVLAAALAGVTTSLHAGGVPARFIRLTVTASRPGVDGAPDYANRSWQICDLKLFGNGAELPLKGAKVVSPGDGVVRDEGPAQCLDGDVKTKYHGRYRQPLVVDLGEVKALDGYTFVTGNDAYGRDPRDWTFDVGVSADDDGGVLWTRADEHAGVDLTRDRRTEVSHPASGITSFTYDALGNVLTKQTANLAKEGKFITYDYGLSASDGYQLPQTIRRTT